MICAADELLDLAGRIMLTHRIAPDHLQRVIGGDVAEARAVVEAGQMNRRLNAETVEKLVLFVNVLLGLERRLHGEPRAIRRAIETPIDALRGRTPAELFGGELDDLRALRRAIETIEAPKERWFRVGH